MPIKLIFKIPLNLENSNCEKVLQISKKSTKYFSIIIDDLIDSIIIFKSRERS